MLCKNCQQEIPDDSKFCTFCGASQDIADPLAAAPLPADGGSMGMGFAPPEPAQQGFAPPAPDYVTPAPEYAPTPDYAPPEYAPPAAPAPDYGPPVAPAPAPASYEGYQSAPPQQGGYSDAPPQQGGYAPAPQQQGGYSQAPQQQQGGYSQAPQQQQGGYSQAPQQGGYASAPPVAYAQPPKKKSKAWLVILIVGLLVLGLLVGGGFFVYNLVTGGSGGSTGGTGGTGGNTGGSTSSSLPSGYSSVVNDSKIEIGFGTAKPFPDGTVTVDIYVINKTNKTIYLLFYDNQFDGKYADDSDVFTSMIDGTAPNKTFEGVIYLDSVYDVDDLNNWKGRIVLIDLDTYETIDEYLFDLNYQ